MFVKMSREEENTPIKVEGKFKRQRDSAEGFTPEVALKFLELTNHYANIKKMAMYISGLPTKEERLAYKEFVLSAVDERETSAGSFKVLYALACDGGYDVEFWEAYNKPKRYNKEECCSKTYEFFIEHGSEEIEVNLRDYNRLVIDYSKCEYDGVQEELSGTCREVYFVNGSALTVTQDSEYFAETSKFVFNKIEESHFYFEGLRDTVVKFEDCETVYVDVNKDCGDKKLKVIAKNVKEISFDTKDYDDEFPVEVMCENVECLKVEGVKIDALDTTTLKNVGKVYFDIHAKFPKVMDLSNVDEVDLSRCDLIGVEEIKFKDGSFVDLSEVENLSQDIDFSNVGELNVCGVDLSYMEEMPRTLKEVHSNEYTIFPKKMYFTSEKVVINNEQIIKCEEIEFAPTVEKVIFNTDVVFPKILDLSNVDKVDLRCCDLTGVEEIKFKKGAKVDLSEVENLSPDIDLSDIGIIDISGVDLSYMEEMPSSWSDVVFDGLTVFPKKAVFRDEEVEIWGDMISKSEEVRFLPTVKKVEFSEDTIFPKILDLSNVDEVDLADCDLMGVEEIKFKKGANVDLSNAKNLPHNIDLSDLGELNVNGVDLSFVEEMPAGWSDVYTDSYTRFPKKMFFTSEEVAITGNNIENCEEVKFSPAVRGVYFESDTKFPKKLDLSTIGIVVFGDCDLSGLEEIKFKDGAKVNFHSSKLPKVLDLSKYPNIELEISDIDNIGDIILKDKEQRDKIMEGMEFSSGLGRMRFRRKCKYIKAQNKISINRENEPCL